jgi:uncharacterized protein (DUF2225 family)
MYIADVGVKCPNCGIKFSTKQLPVLLDLGVRNSELRQDFKGEFPQFESFSICTCPSCGKADWVNNFEETEEVAVLSQPQTTAHLQFRAAALSAERQGRDMFNVGLFYLHAAWCADDNNAVPQAREYRRLAADAFRKSLVDVSCPVDRRPEIEYLIGELLRRAGEFEASQAHFKAVVSRLTGRFALMARKLIKLAESGDSQPVDFDTEGV